MKSKFSLGYNFNLEGALNMFQDLEQKRIKKWKTFENSAFIQKVKPKKNK